MYIFFYIYVRMVIIFQKIEFKFSSFYIVPISKLTPYAKFQSNLRIIMVLL